MANNQVSPYVCGPTVGGENDTAFVGRESILKNIQGFLNDSRHNRMYMYGRARIGKSSLLTRLEVELSKNPECIPVFFTFQSVSGKISQHEILPELIKTINAKLEKKAPGLQLTEASLKDTLLKLSEKKIILLLDEFETIVPIRKQLQQSEKTFFSYLQNDLLSLDPKHLNFVFAVREYNREDITRFFKDFTYSEAVNLFSSEETTTLIRLSQDRGMPWSEQAIQTVLVETGGHPHITQCLCKQVWEEQNKSGNTVTEENVRKIINSSLSRMGGINYVWDDLNAPEQLVVSNIAEAMPSVEENTVSKEDLKLILDGYEFLKQSITAEEQQQAITSLTESGYLIDKGEAYQFQVKLLGRWIKKFKPLNSIEENRKNELCGNTDADARYKAGLNLLQSDTGKHDAIENFQKAIERFSCHRGANIKLIEIYFENNQPKEAYSILQRYYDETRQDKVLARSLLSRLKLNGDKTRQLDFWEKVLNIDSKFPVCPVVREKYQAICEQLGDEAYQQEDLEKAKEYYARAGRNDKVVQVIGVWEKRGDEAYQRGKLKEAQEYYQKAGQDNKVAEIKKRILQSKQADETFLKANEAYHKGELSKAREYYLTALELYRQLQLDGKVAVIQQLINKIVLLETTMVAKEKLIALFNEITADENNEIEAVFVTLTSGEDEDVILYRNKEGSISIDDYARLIGGFTALTNKLDSILDPKKAGVEKLEEASFRFKQGGTSITRLGEKSQVYLFFVTKGTNLAEMNMIRRRYLQEIKKLLKEAKAIDVA